MSTVSTERTGECLLTQINHETVAQSGTSSFLHASTILRKSTEKQYHCHENLTKRTYDVHSKAGKLNLNIKCILILHKRNYDVNSRLAY